MYAYGFRFFFTPLFTVLFTFPSQYWFTIGLPILFSLAGWTPRILTGLLVSRHTQVPDGITDNYPYGTVTLCGPASQPVPVLSVIPYVRSYYPAYAETYTVWALPISLATTPGIDLSFSFCR